MLIIIVHSSLFSVHVLIAVKCKQTFFYIVSPDRVQCNFTRPVHVNRLSKFPSNFWILMFLFSSMLFLISLLQAFKLHRLRELWLREWIQVLLRPIITWWLHFIFQSRFNWFPFLPLYLPALHTPALWNSAHYCVTCKASVSFTRHLFRTTIVQKKYHFNFYPVTDTIFYE